MPKRGGRGRSCAAGARKSGNGAPQARWKAKKKENDAPQPCEEEERALGGQNHHWILFGKNEVHFFSSGCLNPLYH